MMYKTDVETVHFNVQNEINKIFYIIEESTALIKRLTEALATSLKHHISTMSNFNWKNFHRDKNFSV